MKSAPNYISLTSHRHYDVKLNFLNFFLFSGSEVRLNWPRIGATLQATVAVLLEIVIYPLIPNSRSNKMATIGLAQQLNYQFGLRFPIFMKREGFETWSDIIGNQRSESTASRYLGHKETPKTPAMTYSVVGYSGLNSSSWAHFVTISYHQFISIK